MFCTKTLTHDLSCDVYGDRKYLDSTLLFKQVKSVALFDKRPLYQEIVR